MKRLRRVACATSALLSAVVFFVILVFWHRSMSRHDLCAVLWKPSEDAPFYYSAYIDTREGTILLNFERVPPKAISNDSSDVKPGLTANHEAEEFEADPSSGRSLWGRFSY